MSYNVAHYYSPNGPNWPISYCVHLHTYWLYVSELPSVELQQCLVVKRLRLLDGQHIFFPVRIFVYNIWYHKRYILSLYILDNMIVNLDVILLEAVSILTIYFLFHFRYRPLIEFCGTLFQRRNNIRPYMHMPPICQRLPLMRQLLTVLLVFMINLECSMEPTLLPLAGPGNFFEIYYYWFNAL